MADASGKRAEERKARQAEEAARAAASGLWPAADAERRRIYGDLLALTARAGWHLLVPERWTGAAGAARPREPESGLDAVVIGPHGVSVLGLCGGPYGDGGGIVRAARSVEPAVESMDISSSAVQPVLVAAGDGPEGGAAAAAPVRRVERSRLLSMLNSESRRAGFRPRNCRSLAEVVQERLPFLRQHALAAEAAGPSEPSGSSQPAGPAGPMEPPSAVGAGVEEDGLFSRETVEDGAREQAMRAPIEGWMTYLDPRQLPLVRRDWGGPARISGPAGTGKTVVGLHRAAYLAQRTTGRVLYVTYANNLPRVQQTFLRTMSPYTHGRVDFRSLYRYVLELLRERGVGHRLDGDRADSAFFLAWSRVGKREHPQLAAFDGSGYFWRDEVAHVIKGRGITTFDAYQAVPRRGRGVLPPGVRRDMVWRLYEEYQRLLAERGVHDFHDVLRMALAEARRTDEPLRTPYTSVIVDEAQDLPQLGVQLMHALVGDAPNGLLLIGDGQQAVYPGGFRLAEAGVHVRGDRGQVLRSNYRNAPEILQRALHVVADVAYEDLDGTLGSGQRDVELTCRGGTVTETAAETLEEHDRLLVDALRDADGLAGAAILCPTRTMLKHYRALLERAGVPMCPLESYEGVPVPAVKIGSYVKAKGLDFKRVYLPRYDERLAGGLDRSRLFVAMTRARDSLWLGSVRADQASTPARTPLVDGPARTGTEPGRRL